MAVCDVFEPHLASAKSATDGKADTTGRPTGQRGLYAFWRNNSVIFVHNLSGGPREIELDTGIAGDNGRVLSNLLSDDHSVSGEDRKHHLVLEGYGYRWYRVGGLDYLLRRTEA